MKILHVIPSVGPLRGGPSFVVRTMGAALAAQGCQVDIATTDDNGPETLSVPLDRPLMENGVTCHYFRRQTRFYLISWPLFRWLRHNVASYDLLHIHALFSFSVAAAAFWASHYRVPYVVRPLGTLNRWGMENRRPWLKKASLRLLDSRVLSHAAAVHYTSEEEQAEGALVVSVTRPVIIPNPVDLQFDPNGLRSSWLRSRYPAIAGKKIVLFLSRLDPKKGLDLLLTAFARLRTQVPDVALVLGGSGDAAFVERLHLQARDLGLESDIVWAGFLEGDSKKAALAEADVFVLPSYSENFGVAAVEAMACGPPVIVSDQVAIHRSISAAEAGLVVPCQADRLAEAILDVLRNGTLRSKLARNGIALAKTFSVEAVTGQVVSLYRDILESHGAIP